MAGMAGVIGLTGEDLAAFARRLGGVQERVTTLVAQLGEAVRAHPTGEGFMSLAMLQGFQTEVGATLGALRALEASRRATTETAGRYGAAALQAIEERATALGVLGADLRKVLGAITPPKEK
jgi:hypothetical protein